MGVFFSCRHRWRVPAPCTLGALALTGLVSWGADGKPRVVAAWTMIDDKREDMKCAVQHVRCEEFAHISPQQRSEFSKAIEENHHSATRFSKVAWFHRAGHAGLVNFCKDWAKKTLPSIAASADTDFEVFQLRQTTVPDTPTVHDVESTLCVGGSTCHKDSHKLVRCPVPRETPTSYAG